MGAGSSAPRSPWRNPAVFLPKPRLRRTNDEMIQLHGVHKRYRGRREKDVLLGVDLHVEAGDVVLVSGAASSGKTTLLELLYGACSADSGTVEVFGRDVAKLRRSSLALLRRRLGIVPQSLALLPGRSALDNVALALEVRAEPRRLIRSAAAEALSLVGLACDVDTPVSELSMGQRQLVAVARAISRQPAILIADEPSAHLDNPSRDLLVDVLGRMQDRGGAAVIATNDHKLLGLGAYRCWRHLELRQGALTVIAERRRVTASEEEAPEDAYESIEVNIDIDVDIRDNVLPFPLVAQAGGLLE